jgi:hypothetical protein
MIKEVIIHLGGITIEVTPVMMVVVITVRKKGIITISNTDHVLLSMHSLTNQPRLFLGLSRASLNCRDLWTYECSKSKKRTIIINTIDPKDIPRKIT